MSNDRFCKGVGYVEDNVLERYHTYEAAIPHRRRVKSAWQKAAAIAACLALLVSGMLLYSPPEVMHLSAQEVASAWYADGCMPQLAYIGWGGELESFWIQDTRILPKGQYLPVYRVNYDINGIYNQDAPMKELDKKEFSSWLEQNLSCIGAQDILYEITDGNTDLIASLRWGNVDISAGQSKVCHSVTIRAQDAGIPQNGQTIRIAADLKQSQSVKTALLGVKERLCSLVGRSFSDMEFSVSETGVDGYFFNGSDHLLNNRYQRGSDATDYISFQFRVVEKADGIATLNCTRINYFEYRADYDEMYEEQGQVRRLSLSEATELLKKGYVFGGSMCSECAKREIDFSTYDKVELVYQKAYSEAWGGVLAVPVYLFYKQTISATTGKSAIVMAQLPAFELEGLEEYFTQRAAEHDHPYDD